MMMLLVFVMIQLLVFNVEMTVYVTFTCIAFSITLSIMISYSIAESYYTKVDDESYSILKDLKIKDMNRIICAHLNIDSTRNKFEQLKSMIIGTVDIRIITETKLDDTFPHAQFFIRGFSRPYRLDRSGNGGGGGYDIYQGRHSI